MDILEELKLSVAEAVRSACHRDVDPEVVETARRKFGDYQSNVAMQLREEGGPSSHSLAAEIRSALQGDERLASVDVAGPGFLNLRLNFEWVARQLRDACLDELAGLDRTATPKKIVVDFSSPNTAKRMHIGHLRSTIIGDALIRILRLRGHSVIGDNHVGDWGTQFGMLLWAWKHILGQPEIASIDEIEEAYRAVNARVEADSGVAESCRRELLRLQEGHSGNVAIWKKLVDVSRAEAETVYRRLRVTFDLWKGESDYNDALSGIVDSLCEAGHAFKSQGAVIVDFAGHDELHDRPFLIQKSDGAYLYSTTDLATLAYRIQQLNASWVIYVVDKRQSLHFQQLFETATRNGWDVELDHVGFGMMLGEDGKPFRTRSGEVLRLESLIDEAQERLVDPVREKWPDLSQGETESIAADLGIAAIKFADLSMNHASDYKFTWEKLLSPEGRTGLYLQYTLVRLSSLFRHYRDRFGYSYVPNGTVPDLSSAPEKDLGLELLRFGSVVARCERHLAPHLLCDYLYSVCRRFNLLYAEAPIVNLPTNRQNQLESRLLLSRLCQKILALGLQSLNIPAVTRM